VTVVFALQAFNLYDSITTKALRSVLAGNVLESSPAKVELQYGENSYLFIYRFGSLVFFNMPRAEIEAVINTIKSVLGAGLAQPTTESLQITVGATQDKIEFEAVELRKLSLQNLRLIAVTVGQSAAIESFEVNADKMLREASNFMQRLERIGRVPLSGRVLLSFIGSAAGARQHIISNLAVLDPPEEVWRNRDLQRLFKEMQLTFDIDLRFRALDRKLELVQDNIEILSDLVSSRRSTFLELLIVILIIIELTLAVAKRS